MILDNSALYEKFLQLINSEQKPVYWKWSASLIINNEVVPILQVINIERMANYLTQAFDIIFTRIYVTQSVYYDKMLPNKSNIQMVLRKEQTDTNGISKEVGSNYTQTFQAYITEPSSAYVKSETSRIDNPVTDDLSQIRDLHLQLVDSYSNEFRLYEVGGVYRDHTMEEVLRGLMTHPLRVNNGRPISVDLTKPDNDRRYFQIMIENGIRLIHLPHYLQKKYGVYATDIGYYLNRGHWYIYPMLHHKKFDKTTRTLTIIIVPPNEMVASDNTYILDGESIILFSSGEVKHVDRSEHHLTNAGTGVRYAIGTNLIDGFRDVDGSKAVVPANRNFNQFVAEPSATGMENIRSAEGLMTDNPWKQMSETAIGLMSRVEIRWESSNPEVLYPGMPSKILYKHRGIVNALMGTLAEATSKTSTYTNNPSDQRFRSVTTLHLLTERVSN